MWRTLASRIYLCIAVTLALAFLVSAVAIAGLLRTAASLNHILEDNLPSVVAVGELENALLEQRGYITSFIVSGGDEHWLEELSLRKEKFRHGLTVAEEVASTDEERKKLAELRSVADAYDATRQKIIGLIRAGKTDEAKVFMFGEASDLYREAYSRCEALNDSNQSMIREASRQAVATVDWISMCVLGAILLQTAISGALLAIFYHSVLRPLRQMAIDLRSYLPAAAGSREHLRDEVEVVASYLRLVLSDVADFQSTLEVQRQALFDAQRLASIGRLAASLAHEIRNPLTAMKMWLFTARGDVSDRSEVAAPLDAASQEVRRLEAIVRQFLEFSRPPEMRLAWTSSSDLIASSVTLIEPLLREKAITVQQQPATNLPSVYVDREQMIQVIVNLLRNAAESAPVKGQITTSVTQEPDAGGALQVVLRVGDNGPGIPADLQRKVFEPFFTTKDQGTGLGLSIVASIVMRHGGRVEVESLPQGGACLAVHLPLPKSEKDA